MYPNQRYSQLILFALLCTLLKVQQVNAVNIEHDISLSSSGELGVRTSRRLSVRDTALCDIIAATNIQSQGDFAKWSCTSHVPDTDPCTNSWQGVTCAGTDVDRLAFFTASTALTGM